MIKKIVKYLAPYGLVRAYALARAESRPAAPTLLLFRRRIDSYDVAEMSQFLASTDSAQYYQQHMLKCATAASDLELLDNAVSWRRVEGAVLEFGVASGRTINHLANTLPAETIFGFDWFQGLPETWRAGFDVGFFAQPIPAVASNVILEQGLFADTLPAFAAAMNEDISLLHVDCDLYSSTETIFHYLAGRIVPGTVIVFDEYFNYPGWRECEYKAFQEFLQKHDRRYEYLGLVPDHQQVCVRIVG